MKSLRRFFSRPQCRHCGGPTHFHSQGGDWTWFRCLDAGCDSEENYSLTVVKPKEEK